MKSIFPKQYLGTFSSDKLPALKSFTKGTGFIVNLEPSTMAGSHWVSVYNTGDRCLYIDSYGIAPSSSVLKWIGKKKYLYNSSQYQELTSENCGEFCCYFLSKLFRGEPLYDVLYKTLDVFPSDKNEKTVSKYFSSLNKTNG
jgi:hypothetical protein